MTEKDAAANPGHSLFAPNSGAAAVNVPLATRLSIEIPKPKDWQAFQRNCVLLFRAELNDPNAQEYGRNGQDQAGIDILGRRDGNPDRYVGVQCRHITKPLKEPKILADCRAALGLNINLKEIIFATTAPNDTGATNAAITAERTLRAEGHDLAVVVYGWEQLQILIASHDTAYIAFAPSIVATSAPQPPSTSLSREAEFASQVAARVVAQLHETGVAPPPRDTSAPAQTDEDPALHARIDTYRDLFKDQNQPRLAEKGLLDLLEGKTLDGKPWARFRVETNLGSIALTLGRETEGVARFESAFAIRPEDPKAIANLALARTIQGRYEEAMDLARQALEATPRADHAVAILLQAAARSTWQGDPEALIPADLVETEHADVGLAEFLRRRSMPGWEERCLVICRRHLDIDASKRIRAISILSLALASGGIMVRHVGPVSIEELNAAADDLKALTEHTLAIGFADQHDLLALLNNAALLLRIAGRHAECETLLLRGLPQAPDAPQLRRLLALAQASLDRRVEAIKTLADDQDPENRLLAAELSAADNPGAALALVLAIDPKALHLNLAVERWDLVGDLALRCGNTETLSSAIAALRELNPSHVLAELLEIRSEQMAGLDAEAVRARLRAIAAALPPDAELATRFPVAEELRRQDLPEEASLLLEGHTDLSRMNPVTSLYLESLAAARRDDAFRRAIAAASPDVRENPAILWTTAAHAWNLGDLPAAYRTIEELLKQEPDNLRARMLKIEILLRQDRSTELFAELEKRVEDLAWTRLRDRFRIASLLGHFGYADRAATFAYRLFLEHRDKSQAWMTLSMLVLMEGRGNQQNAHLWDAPVVAPNVAVDVRYGDGEEQFLIVEPDPNLRRLDDESWEPEHSLVRTLIGLREGARFADSSAREGTIIKLRHKYVARLHYIMQHYESRFPEIFGFRMVSVDVKRSDGLDEVIAELKARREWVEQQQEEYRNGPWPLGVLAHRLGLDTIEVSIGIASQGIPLKVAVGTEPEREAAASAVRSNAGKGCVLDLLAFWTAWQLKALGAVATTCGPIHVPQSVMDRLRARRERIDLSAQDGLRSARYEGGKLIFHEVAPEVVREWRDDIDRAIAWIEANATICPLVVRDDLPHALREHLRAEQSDIFDSLVVAVQMGVLLITDDLPTREFSRLVGGARTAWLHQVFEVAFDLGDIDADTFVRWSANLVEAGHNYIGVTGEGLARALQLDAQAGEAPGYLFKTLSGVIGGRGAEPRSHIRACLHCLRELWTDPDASAYRPQATGLLLRQLVRERHDDYQLILRALYRAVRTLPQLVEYMQSWAQGHFISQSVLEHGSTGEG